MSVGPASQEPPEWERRSVEAGGWRLTALSDGFFRLDGGSMWGVVPANLWRSMTPPLEDNTILLALRPFLAERGDLKVVVEVGIGDRWEEKWRDIYHILPTATLEDTLRACGVTPEEVTHVVASHCHWDHIGAQVVERDGQLVPRFANAVHHAPLVEVQMARNPDHARKGSYRSEDVSVIEAHGLLQAFEGSVELLPGLRTHVLGGHSDGVSVITFGEEEEGDTAVFWSDVVPTTHHAQPPYIMAYDIDVVRSFDVRSRWLKRAADEGWIGLFYHDVDHAFARIRRDGRRFGVEATSGQLGAPAG
ncbi:MAG TPA: MBL fold metallo-hydrolase [Planctomycetota bacterium]|jgi:glyoxylase-like metal-dependent hydrolase (beta-lactamase superfamily II)|nr:MBL fold metallo-hydrolase [Planctomycetota bacterium]